MSKKIIEKTIVTKKEFLYKNADCSLGFTLRVDNSSEMRAFRSCLEEALRDINELLQEVKN